MLVAIHVDVVLFVPTWKHTTLGQVVEVLGERVREHAPGSMLAVWYPETRSGDQIDKDVISLR